MVGAEKKDPSSVIDILIEGRKVPVKEKLSLGGVNAAGTMLGTVLAIYIFRYYVNILGLALEYYILANFIFLFWNTLNDFFFGMLADRTKHRLGRRIPYIRYGAAFVAITFIFFWFPLPGSAPGDVTVGQEIIFAQLVIALLAYDTVMTII